MRPKLRRSIRTFLTPLVVCSLAGCVTERAGTAEVDRGEPNTVAFNGIVSPETSTPVRYIFVTHGMGPTEATFGKELLGGLERANFMPVAARPGEGNWVPVRLPARIAISGDALSCVAGPDQPPCEFDTFGSYKIDRRANGTETVIVYQYYWDAEIRGIERAHMHNDDEVKRSSLLTGGLKHKIINYGFTDAAAYLGPLGEVLRSSAEGAICAMMTHAATGVPHDPSRACRFADLLPDTVPRSARFTFIAQSLGSRLLFDTLTKAYTPRGDCEGRETAVKKAIFDRTDSFFMLANQLPLLAIGQVKVRPAEQAEPGCGARLEDMVSPQRSARRRLTAGAALVSPGLPPLQIISFQDPEDLLGFRFTDDLANNDDDRLQVVQVTHRNSPVRWAFGSTFSNPSKVHAVELERDSSLRLILCGATVTLNRRVKPTRDCLVHPRRELQAIGP